VRSNQVALANDAEVYLAWAQDNTPTLRIVVRSNARDDEILRLVQAKLNQIDPDLFIFQPGPMSLIVNASLGQTRLVMTLLGVFASIALLLATVGIYGAVAYTVEQRTTEIGVRMALGAQARDVLWLVTAQGMRPVFVGLAVGLMATLALGRLLSAQLYETSPHNPLLLASTLIVLTTAAMFACVFPARKAMLLNPAHALRAN
jgi:putative ABC transport system permease protein